MKGFENSICARQACSSPSAMSVPRPGQLFPRFLSPFETTAKEKPQGLKVTNAPLALLFSAILSSASSPEIHHISV